MTGIDYDTLGPLMSAMPYCRALGIEIRAVGPGWAEATVAWRDDLVGDPATREPLTPTTMGQLKKALLDRGLLPFIADNRIHVVPPAVITDADARRGMAIIDEVLAGF